MLERWEWLVSTALAMLAGLGVGSGGLLTVWLTEARGMDSRVARIVNLVFFFVALATAAAYHLRRTRVPVRLLLFVILLGIPMTLLGTLWGNVMNTTLLRHIYGGFLVGSGVLVLWRQIRTAWRKRREKQRKNRQKQRGCA